MSITKYKAFVTVVDTGSLTKASKLLNYTQPGISQMISSLETEAGFPLLIRNKDYVLPTENAKRLMFHYRQIINQESQIQEMYQEINGIRSGNIHVGAFNSILTNWLPEIMYEYHSKFPEINILLSEHDYLGIAKNLGEGMIDVAFGSYALAETYKFDFIPLQKDPLIVVLPQNHPLTVYDKIPVSALHGHDLIMPFEGSDDIVNYIISQEDFEPTIKHRVTSDNAMPSMVSQGFGYAIMSELLLKNSPFNVETRPFEHGYYRTLGIAVKSLKNISNAVKELIDLSTNALLN